MRSRSRVRMKSSTIAARSASMPIASSVLRPKAIGELEGLAQLVVDVLGEQLQRVAAIVGAREDLACREIPPSSDRRCGWLLLVVDADRDQPRIVSAGRAQHVEPRAVAVIDLEAEPRPRPGSWSDRDRWWSRRFPRQADTARRSGRSGQSRSPARCRARRRSRRPRAARRLAKRRSSVSVRSRTAGRSAA